MFREPGVTAMAKLGSDGCDASAKAMSSGVISRSGLGQIETDWAASVCRIGSTAGS